MQLTDQTGMSEVLDRLKETLKPMPGWSLTNVIMPVGVLPRMMDAICTIESPGGRVDILIVFMGSTRPGTLRSAIHWLKMIRSSLVEPWKQLGEAYEPGEAWRYTATQQANVPAATPMLWDSAATMLLPVLGARFISDEGFRVCIEEEVGCIDESGNCRLPLPGAYIEIRGRKNRSPEIRRSMSLFSPKSSRITRLLLSDAGRWWQVQELAHAASISLGLVSRVKDRLIEEDLVVEQERRIRPRSPRKLIDAWVETYRYKRNTLREYYASDSVSATESSIAKWCVGNDIRYALGLFSAASRIAPHVRMNKTFVFVDAEPETVASALHLKPVSSGANVVLMTPYDAGVFFGCTEYEGIDVVSDVQAYIDLITYKGRGEEAADFLMQQVLEKRWSRDPITASAK